MAAILPSSTVTAHKTLSNVSSDDSDNETDTHNTGESTSVEPQDKSEEYIGLRQQLSEMPFEDVEKFKQEVGLKTYKEIMQSGKPRTRPERTRFKRENKNRPMEVSSKKKPRKMRQVFSTKKKLYRDPRFDDLSGTFDEELFKQSYNFISDIKRKEKIVLMKKFKNEKNEEKKEQIGTLIKRMNYQEQSDRDKEKRATILTRVKQKERELVKDGKVPFHLKQSDRKKLELAEKFKELKKSGKVEKYMQKRRKKNASKEKKKLPDK